MLSKTKYETNEKLYRFYILYILRGWPLDLCILIDFPIHVDAISIGFPILCSKGSQPGRHCYLFMKFGLILANSADPDLHCLSKYSFRGFPEYKGFMDGSHTILMCVYHDLLGLGARKPVLAVYSQQGSYRQVWVNFLVWLQPLQQFSRT